MMDAGAVIIPGWLWGATILGLIAVIVVDIVIVDRRAHVFTAREAVHWVIFYVILAALFAGFLFWYFDYSMSAQFVAGYLTEYSLSVDNLFIFMLIMSSFAVPAAYQHRVLLVGIVIALVLRGILIVLGAELLHRFSATFYLFGGFLLFTAWKVWRSDDSEPDPQGNGLIRYVERHIPTTAEYSGTKLTVRLADDSGRIRRHITPMALVMLAIGTTDLLFAVDSIPAIFGLTTYAYIVFTANAFALMGLRQLYFILHGLLSKLIYLNRGLAFILAFIGVKLVLEAVRLTTHVEVPEIPIWASLVVIVAVLVITAVTSLIAVRRHPELAESSPEAKVEEESREIMGEGLPHPDHEHRPAPKDED